MVILGICGASGSGKSTLARRLAEEMPHSVVCLRQDSYYRDHPELSSEERESLNYDEPSAFDHEEFRRDLLRLREGLSITEKGYDFTNHRRLDPLTQIEPRPIVICEGIHLFYEESVRNLMDLRIYMQVDADICLLRRIKRDMRDRGRSLESISNQYRETVKPMFEEYIQRYVQYADLVIPVGGKNPRVLTLLSEYLAKRAFES